MQIDQRIRLTHWGLLFRLFPILLLNKQRRHLFIDIWRFCRQLPAIMNHPLPIAQKQLVSQKISLIYNHTELRQMVDLVAWLDRSSPLGICLRRSLLRYYFLGCAHLPIAVQFGAKFKSETQIRNIGGHAWTTLDGKPYYEHDSHWHNFTVMTTWQPISSLVQ